MADGHHFLAMDFGAESGRGEIVTLAGGKVTMEEVQRFPNRPVRLGKTLHWDFPFLFGEVLNSLRACAHRGVKLSGIGVDTWGVDFGLLGCDGALLGNPVHYRDSRTENIHDYSNRFLSRDEIFSLTAYEPWAISSLFQLLSMQRDGSPLLGVADTFLNTPDLFGYFLTGTKASDRSIANTSNLMGTDGQWSRRIIDAFHLPAKMFAPLVEPGTVLGGLSPSVRKDVGLGEVPVITTCGHDTSAAVAAVPGRGENWAFISCGTWSILGCLLPAPISDKKCWDLGFTNEYTIGGWYLGRNISGLWLVQQLRKKWDIPKDPWDYVRMTKEAAAQNSKGLGLLNAGDPSLLAPHDMEEALLKLVRGGATPDGRGQLVRLVLESLALEYRRGLDAMSDLVGWQPKAVYLVGGGIANKLLCQLTADACGCPVYAGADQCTAMGNALIQAAALGVLKGPDDIREVMRSSTQTTVYEPKDAGLWQEKRAQYARVTRKA
jgi:rhamnulokinase